MKYWTTALRLAATAALAFATATAPAAPVTLRLNGQITGYDFIDLGTAAGLTVGTAVNLTLSFNETWSDGSYSFADPLGPVSGSATVGSNAFTFTGGQPYAYYADFTTNIVTKVLPLFTGTGPTLGGGDFYALFATFTPALALESLSLAYGFSTTYPDGTTATLFGYALISLDDYTVTPGGPNRLPVPATLPLVMVALMAAGWRRGGGERSISTLSGPLTCRIRGLKAVFQQRDADKAVGRGTTRHPRERSSHASTSSPGWAQAAGQA